MVERIENHGGANLERLEKETTFSRLEVTMIFSISPRSNNLRFRASERALGLG